MQVCVRLEHERVVGYMLSSWRLLLWACFDAVPARSTEGFSTHQQNSMGLWFVTDAGHGRSLQHHLQKGGGEDCWAVYSTIKILTRGHPCHGGKTEIHPGACCALRTCFPNVAQMRTSESRPGRVIVGYFRFGGLWDVIFRFCEDQLQHICHRLCYRERRRRGPHN